MVKNTIFVISKLCIDTEDWCAGLEYLNRWFSLEKKPEAQKYQLVGTAYFENSQSLIASQYFKKAIEIEQSNEAVNASIVMKSHLVLADIYLMEKNYIDARINAETALKYLNSLPNSVENESGKATFCWFLANAYKGLVEPDKAYQNITEAIDLNGDSVPEEWSTFREELSKEGSTR